MKALTLVAAAASWVLLGCDDDGEQPVQMTASSVVVFGQNDPYEEIRNEEGGIPAGDDEPIFAGNIVEEPLGELHPVTHPDGRPVTRSTWLRAQGTVTATCEADGTRFDMQFSGLIPGGTYTGWIFLLAQHKTPVDPIPIEEIRAMGALGPPDGSQNAFVASDDGVGALSLLAPAGELSMLGEQPACVLTDVPGVLLVLDYHMDGMTHGGEPGPDPNDASHLHTYF